MHRRNEFRATKIMLDRARANEKIKFMTPYVVEEVHNVENKSVESVQLRNVDTNELSKIEVEGVFVAIGHDPNAKIFRGQIDMDEAGYIITHDGPKTSVESVFAAGDVQDHHYRQAITAAGSGCMAAIDAEKFLADTRYNAGGANASCAVFRADVENFFSESYNSFNLATRSQDFVQPEGGTNMRSRVAARWAVCGVLLIFGGCTRTDTPATSSSPSSSAATSAGNSDSPTAAANAAASSPAQASLPPSTPPSTPPSRPPIVVVCTRSQCHSTNRSARKRIPRETDSRPHWPSPLRWMAWKPCHQERGHQEP